MMKFGFIAAIARRMLPLSILMACSLTVWAQPDGPGGPPPDGPPPSMQSSQGPSVERQLKQLTQLLALTGDQQAQVKSILADRRQQVEALLKNSSRVKPDADSAPQPPSQEEMQSQRDAMKAIREASNSKIAALLSADQKAKFTAWQKKSVRSTEQADGEMPPPPPDGEGPPDGGGGPDGGPGGGGPGGGGPGGPPGA